MNKDGTLNAERLQALVKGITDAASQLESVAGNAPLGPAVGPLMGALQKLQMEMTEPHLLFMQMGMQPHLNGVLRVASDLGLFDLIPVEGSMSSATIAEKTGAEESLIVRLMRTMTSQSIFAEAGKRDYTHNKNSEALKRQCLRSLLKHWCTDTIPTSLRLDEYLKQNGYKNPVEAEESPVKHVMGHSFFNLMKEYPERGATFDDAMTSLNQGWNRETSVFAYDQLASTENPERVALVDVGGGRGHNAKLIREHYPELKDMKVIVQDLPNVIPTPEDGKNDTRPDIEYMSHDFFKPQPIKGAKAYYFSHILHDWSDEKNQLILKNTVDAMDWDSRILIRDFVLPDVGCPAIPALLDINMMTIASMERDENDWKELLASVGLKWKALHCEGGRDWIIEAVLA